MPSMNNPIATIAATALLSALVAPLPAPVEAASGIQRCESADGTLVYTDKACAAFDAKPTPMSGELLSRIALEETRPERGAGLEGTVDAALPLDAGRTAYASVPIGRRSPASGCARTPTQLQMDLRGALALGNVNRIAESYHWAGMSSKAGERTLDRLQHLAGRQVVDSRYYDARIGFVDSTGFADAATLLADASGGDGDAGMLQLVLGDDGSRSVVDFDVHKYAGCYFVSF
jgi:hypothetical protein